MDKVELNKIKYYYRNGFARKDIAAKTGLNIRQVERRITKLRKEENLKRWWEE